MTRWLQTSYKHHAKSRYDHGVAPLQRYASPKLYLTGKLTVVYRLGMNTFTSST